MYQPPHAPLWVFIVALLILPTWTAREYREYRQRERLEGPRYPADIFVGILLVVMLHAVGVVPSLDQGSHGFGKVLDFAWWVTWNLFLILTLALLAGLLFRKLPRSIAWTIRVAVWFTPLLYIGADYLLHRAAPSIVAMKPVAPPEEMPAAKLAELRSRVEAKWLADLESAGAIGDPGEVPPMLTATVSGSQVLVTNRGADTVCVQVARVGRLGNKPIYARCSFDETDCRNIAEQGTERFTLHASGKSYQCDEGLLEFRVGLPTRPEPSWWTRSAFVLLEQLREDDDARYGRYSAEELNSEKSRLESQLGDAGRATRWRAALGALRAPPGS